jgi:hypothetical protein
MSLFRFGVVLSFFMVLVPIAHGMSCIQAFESAQAIKAYQWSGDFSSDLETLAPIGYFSLAPRKPELVGSGEHAPLKDLYKRLYERWAQKKRRRPDFHEVKAHLQTRFGHEIAFVSFHRVLLDLVGKAVERGENLEILFERGKRGNGEKASPPGVLSFASKDGHHMESATVESFEMRVRGQLAQDLIKGGDAQRSPVDLKMVVSTDSGLDQPIRHSFEVEIAHADLPLLSLKDRKRFDSNGNPRKRVAKPYQGTFGKERVQWRILQHPLLEKWMSLKEINEVFELDRGVISADIFRKALFHPGWKTSSLEALTGSKYLDYINSGKEVSNYKPFFNQANDPLNAFLNLALGRHSNDVRPLARDENLDQKKKLHDRPSFWRDASTPSLSGFFHQMQKIKAKEREEKGEEFRAREMRLKMLRNRINQLTNPEHPDFEFGNFVDFPKGESGYSFSMALVKNSNWLRDSTLPNAVHGRVRLDPRDPDSKNLQFLLRVWEPKSGVNPLLIESQKNSASFLYNKDVISYFFMTLFSKPNAFTVLSKKNAALKYPGQKTLWDAALAELDLLQYAAELYQENPNMLRPFIRPQVVARLSYQAGNLRALLESFDSDRPEGIPQLKGSYLGPAWSLQRKNLPRFPDGNTSE